MTDFAVALPTVYQEFIALSRSARFNAELGRRETWGDTVKRFFDFWYKQLNAAKNPVILRALEEVCDGIANLDIMPSMRTLMTAGPALERSNVASYNCSYATISGSGPTINLWDDQLTELGYDEPIRIKLHNPIVFDEMFFILLNGTGAGFSVERQFISDMPTVGKNLSRASYKKSAKNYPKVPREDLSSFDKRTNTILVADSKEGWASALRIFIIELYNGNFEVKYDTSAVRPAGSPLRTFGGRASGPDALIEMFENIRVVFMAADGRKLTSIECHDVMCFIANAVVVGGVRRAAMLSMSNPSDDRMRHAKSGDWWVDNGPRRLANNSAVYEDKPDAGVFMREWQALYDSKSGERGFINRRAAIYWAGIHGRILGPSCGYNPCVEIALRDRGLCNLSAGAVRPEDTLEDLKRKVRLATIIGTMQATLTDFSYLSPEWKKNAEEERLIGVSLPGAMDHPVLQNVSDEAKQWIEELARVVDVVNDEWAEILGIDPAAAKRCQKPAGNSGEHYNVASGIHARYAPFYIRRVRADEKDPLARVMREQGFPCEVDVTSSSTLIFSFPVKAPEGAVFRDDRTAIQQLEYWLMWKRYWADHNVSVTIYVKEHEWVEVGAWVYKHFDEVTGISFLPHSGHTYRQAPFEEITEEEYLKMSAIMPTFIDYEALSILETSDHTIGSQEFACSAGGCELI